MILPDAPNQPPTEKSELRIVADFLERLLNREVNLKLEIPPQPPAEITVQPAEMPPVVTQWRFEFERDRFGRTIAITATARN